MKRVTLLTGGAVAAALVLAAGAVTVANAVSMPGGSSRVLDDRGVDTATVSPSPAPSIAHPATPEPGDDGQGGVVTVPPAGPTVIDRHGDETRPDDDPGAPGADNGFGQGNGNGQGKSDSNGKGQGDDHGQGHR